MGTPEEFEAIIDAGFAHKLRIDFWLGRKKYTQEELDSLPAFAREYVEKNPNPFIENVEMLTGGTEADKNFRAPWMLIPGKYPCKFLVDERCSLHDLGLKPEQCREACCDDEKNEAKENLHYAFIWNTENGKRVIEKFKTIVGI
jgi:hypothetical protein